MQEKEKNPRGWLKGWNEFRLYEMGRAYGSEKEKLDWNEFQLYKMGQAYGSKKEKLVELAGMNSSHTI